MGTVDETQAGGWNYSGNPADSDLDWVRWRTGDTNAAEPLQSDAELNAAIAETANRTLAAARACDAIAAKFARLYSQSLSSPNGVTHSNNYAQKYEHYVALALAVRAEGAKATSAVAGGISLSDKAANAANLDLVPQPFWRGQFDYE